MVHPSDLVRYALWSLVAVTADANRREYHMLTTWFPHFATYTFIMWLPELYSALVPNESVPKKSEDIWDDLQRTLDVMVRDNPAYTTYVTPLAIGFILSHPRFNIYKGKLAEIRLAGFGLDALPHGATAFSLTTLFCDTVEKVAPTMHSDNVVSTLIEESARHPAVSSGAILTLATLWWEIGEYLIHRHELALRGDVRLINMQWSLRDTLNDCAANLIGWGLALGWRSLHRNRRLRA